MAHVFVINLERDDARRASITRQLEVLGLPFEMVSAVYGAALLPDELALHYDDSKAKWRMSRSLVPAEIGCALSHLNVYRRMIERSVGHALILEDDVILPAELTSFLEESDRLLDVRRPEVWLLSPAEGDESRMSARIVGSNCRVLPYVGGFYTSSYLLTLSAARALLTELYPVGDVADCWKRMSRYRVVDLYVTSPPQVWQDLRTFGSSTAPEVRAAFQRGLGSMITYKARRARAVLRDAVYGPYRRWFRPYGGVASRRY